MGWIDKFDSGVGDRLRDLLDRAIGSSHSLEIVEIYRGILEDAERRVEAVRHDRSIFPYNYILVQIAAAGRDRRAVYTQVFCESDELERDLRQAIERLGCGSQAGLRVCVVIVDQLPAGVSRKPFQVDYWRLESSADRPQALPHARLAVVRGNAARQSYAIDSERTAIGRCTELYDDRQRLLRRNDIAFNDSPDSLNATVSREHAHILFDARDRCFRLHDDGSSSGTRVVRNGVSMDVRPGQRGVRLEAGDEIYIGKACLRFEIGEGD